MEDDDVSVGKFATKFILWFLLWGFLLRIVLSIVGNFMAANMESIYSSIVVNAIVLAITTYLAIRIAMIIVIKKNRIQTIALPTFQKIMIAFFLLIAVLEVGSRYWIMNTTYERQVEKTLVSLLEEKYQQANTEEEKQELNKKKETAIQKGQEQVNIYMAILGTLELVIFIIAIPYSKKMLEVTMTL